VKPNQKDSVASTMLRHFEQVENTKKTRFPRKFRSNIQKADWLDRVHLNLPFLHPVAAADFDPRLRPNSHRTRDFSASDPLAKPLGKEHQEESERVYCPALVSAAAVILTVWWAQLVPGYVKSRSYPGEPPATTI